MALVSEFCLIAGSVDLGGIESSRKKASLARISPVFVTFFHPMSFFSVIVIVIGFVVLVKGDIKFSYKVDSVITENL